MKFLNCCLILVFLAGCATGGMIWHKKRLKEIEELYANKEITKLEYIQLKNEADLVRVTR